MYVSIYPPWEKHPEISWFVQFMVGNHVRGFMARCSSKVILCSSYQGRGHMPKIQARIYLPKTRGEGRGFYVEISHKRKNHERTFMWRVSMKPRLGTPTVGNFLKRQG